MISMIAFFMGAYGLYLRIQEASSEWKEEIACLLFSATAAGGADDGVIRTTPSGTSNGGQGIFGQFRASRASMSGWDEGKMTRGVTLFSRPSSRNVMKEAENFEFPVSNRPSMEIETPHAVTITRDADLEQGVTYSSATQGAGRS